MSIEYKMELTFSMHTAPVKQALDNLPTTNVPLDVGQLKPADKVLLTTSISHVFASHCQLICQELCLSIFTARGLISVNYVQDQALAQKGSDLPVWCVLSS